MYRLSVEHVTQWNVGLLMATRKVLKNGMGLVYVERSRKDRVVESREMGLYCELTSYAAGSHNLGEKRAVTD